MAEAENIKLGVEQSQRDRRRQTENMQVMIMEMFMLLLSLMRRSLGLQGADWEYEGWICFAHIEHDFGGQKFIQSSSYQREPFKPVWFHREGEENGEEGVARYFTLPIFILTQLTSCI